MEISSEFSFVDSLSRFVDFDKLQAYILRNLGDQLDKLKTCPEPDHDDIVVLLTHLRTFCYTRKRNSVLGSCTNLNDEFQITLKDAAFVLLQQTDTSRRQTFEVACELFSIAIEICDRTHSHVLINAFLRTSVDSLLCTCPASNVEINTTVSSKCGTNPVEPMTKIQNSPVFSVESVVESLCFLLDSFLSKTSTNSNNFVASITASDSVQQILFAQIKTLLVKSLLDLNEHLLIKVLLELLPKINAVEKSSTTFTNLIASVWDVVMQSFNSASGETSTCDSRGYLILSCICDHIFSPGNSNTNLPMWANCQFWKVLQNSLVHENPLQRKRALYFLKRILDYLLNEDVDIPASSCGHLFSWKCDQSVEIQKAYDDIMLILETLEEKQVHILKPLFPVVHGLISKTRENESWFLHTSWLAVIFQRLLQHDSKTIKKWSIEMICDISWSDIPFLIQKSEFFWSSFLKGLNDNALYARQPNESFKSSAKIGNVLIKHNLSCYQALRTNQNQAHFFQQILKNLQNQSWGSVPLLYVTRALTGIPQGPMWNSTSVHDLRNVLTNSLSAHEAVIRGAVQSFLLEAFIHLMDLSELTINDLSLLIGTFKKKECLRRGTDLYAHVVLWLQQAICDADKQMYELSVENVLLFLRLSLQNILEHNQGVTLKELKDSCEILRTARMVVLLYDANIPSLYFNENSLRSSLEPLIDTLKTCHSRPYMSPGRPEKCLAFLLTLAAEAECNGCPHPDNLQNCITSIFEEVTHHLLPYVMQQLFNDVENDNEKFGNIRLYFHLLEHLAKDAALHLPLQVPLSHLCQKSLIELKKASKQGIFLQRYIAIQCFHIACLYVGSSSSVEMENQNMHLKDFMDIFLTGNMLSDVPMNKSLISFADKVHKTIHIHSDNIAVLWSCICFCLQKCSFLKRMEKEKIQQQSFKAMEVCSDIAFNPIFTCLESCLMTIAETDPEKVMNTIEACWNYVSNIKINAAFWDAMDAFIKMTFQQSFISNVALTPHLLKYAENIVKRSESCHGIFLPLVRRLAAIWKMPEHQLTILSYMPVLVQALTFGHIHRRDQRILQDTIKFVSTLGEHYVQAQGLDRSLSLDSEVRVEAVILLLNLRNSPHRDRIVAALVLALTGFETKVTKTRSRHFANSFIHRVKQRVWQTLLVLQPLFTQELAESLMGSAFKTIVEESLQPSVRYLMEWIILKILHDHPTKIQILWSSFEWAMQCRVGSLGSFLSIICHLGNLLYNREEQISFIENAFPIVLPWCMAQHFNTRIYAQVALQKLWICCKENHFECLLEKYSPMESLFTINIEHGGTSKGIQNLLEDYNFSTFHQIRHYSLATIFYELPRLSNVTEEEWIEPEVFAKRDPLGLLKLPETYIMLYNPDTALSQCTPGSWVNRSAADNGLSSAAQENKDIQKKLTPWKQMIPDYQALAAASQSISWKKQQNTDGLIVVASLIDRAPNLGGLCRTCEVFGVTTYVIGSLRYTEDKQFQNLSVSADRWVQIEEVKPQDLPEFLLIKRKQGYTIIGAEQTANSSKLGTFQFPKKTVLLLGNEKEGIPVELIQLVDICVEIPQEGLIRSLNVHVTGAILIWEYARQKYCS